MEVIPPWCANPQDECCAEAPCCPEDESCTRCCRLKFVNDVTVDFENSGAEWWVVVCSNEDEDVDLHFDKDYEVEDYGYNVHPLLGTVTYLTDVGVPTVVTSVAEDYHYKKTDKGERLPLCGTDAESVSHGCVITYPKTGKHITFDGRTNCFIFTRGSLNILLFKQRKRYVAFRAG